MSDVVAAPAPVAANSATPEPKTPAAPAKEAPHVSAKTVDKTLPPPNSKLVEKKEEIAAAEVKKEAERRKYQGKVHGKDKVYELTDDEVAVRLQKGEAADENFRQSAEIRKAAAQLIADLKRDPWGVLKDPAFGHDLEAIAEERLAEKYKADLMTEEQKKAYELEKQVNEYKSREQRHKDQQQRTAQKEMEKKVYAEEEKKFIEAATKHQLPQDMDTLSMMAEIALLNHEHGIDLSADQMAAEVNARMDARMQKILPKLDGEVLLKRLGDAVVDKVLKAKVAQFKAKQINPPPVPKQEPAPVQDPVRKPMSIKDWRKAMRSDD